uniref:SOCS box domain-containing protein n=1 Tax=Monopterus albus TaxID=43700 RepID=A0A3Q3KDI1_MONAL
MVVCTVTTLHNEQRGGSCCPRSSLPWDPAEDLRCITTTFQYLQTSGTPAAQEIRVSFLGRNQTQPKGNSNGYIHQITILIIVFHSKTKPDSVQHSARGNGVPLKLMYPLHKPQAFPSLQHLARLTINRHMKHLDQLPLPQRLLHYLQDYPFHI